MQKLMLLPILFVIGAGAWWFLGIHESGQEFSFPGFSLIRPVLAQGTEEFPDADAGL
jgi:hypothetical protein